MVDLSQNQSNTSINDSKDPGKIHSPSSNSLSFSHNPLSDVSDLDISSCP